MFLDQFFIYLQFILIMLIFYIKIKGLYWKINSNKILTLKVGELYF
jgi:hypothetical protein